MTTPQVAVGKTLKHIPVFCSLIMMVTSKPSKNRLRHLQTTPYPNAHFSHI